MGYQSALEANDVTVKEFKEFGSYQGTWIAILEDGRFVEGSYGSCSGCDAFQGEFGYEDEEIIKQENGKYYKGNYHWDDEYEVTEEEANLYNEKHKAKLRQFGASYLASAETKEEITARFERKCEDGWAWEDDKEILEWLKKQP
jgi:hypothetical protein